jgi:putative phosphoribosyl transferase
MIFRDRIDAGRILAEELGVYANRKDVVILALPRGGVPVAVEVAKVLNAPLDVFLVRKLGVPGHEELAMGAIASGNVQVVNRDLVNRLSIPERLIQAAAKKERQELIRRERLYRDDRPAPEVTDKTVILVDDGLATGASVSAAVKALRQQYPKRIVIAVPTAAASTCEALREIADEVICASTPQPFSSVGAWYEDFSQTTDDEVRELLDQAASGLELASSRHKGK